MFMGVWGSLGVLWVVGGYVGVWEVCGFLWNLCGCLGGFG